MLMIGKVAPMRVVGISIKANANTILIKFCKAMDSGITLWREA